MSATCPTCAAAGTPAPRLCSDPWHSDERAGGPLAPIVQEDPTWGRLTIDREKLLDAMGEATRAVYAASIAGQFRNEADFPVASAISESLGGLSQTIDGLIDVVSKNIPPL